MSDAEHEPAIESTGADGAPVKEIPAHRSAARTALARQMFRDALATNKGATDEDSEPVAAAPAAREPEKPAAAPPEADPEPEIDLDLDALRLRRLRAAERDDSAGQHSGPSFEDLIDKPGPTMRGLIESMRGEAFADDEWKAEAADLVSRLAKDVLGVPLPAHTLAKLDAVAAKKSLKHMRTSAAKREQAERERAERDEKESAWVNAADAIDRKLAAGSEEAKAYPWLAAEDAPGEIVVDLIRAANESGKILTFAEAARAANDHFRRRHEKRSARLEPPKPPAKPATPSAPTSGKPWSRAGHRASAIEAFRRSRGE